MTDEERKKLCKNLRDRNNVAYQDCEDAADELERLAEENGELKDRIDRLEHEMKYGYEND